jgi:hypothetical protein
MSIYSNNNRETVTVKDMIDMFVKVYVAMQVAVNYASITVHPQRLNGITESAILTVANVGRVTLLHHEELNAWEILAGEQRAVIRGGDAQWMTDQVRRIMMPFD